MLYIICTIIQMTQNHSDLLYNTRVLLILFWSENVFTCSRSRAAREGNELNKDLTGKQKDMCTNAPNDSAADFTIQTKPRIFNQ